MSQHYIQISAATASSQTHGQLAINIVAGKQRWISLPVSYALAVQPVADCAAAAPEPPARQLPWTSRGAGHGFLIEVRHRPVDRVRPALRASFYCWDPGLVPAEQIIRCQDFIQETNGKP